MMKTNILQEKINIIARNTNSISFTYEISSDQIRIVQHQDQNEVKLDLDYYYKGLLDGTYGHLDDHEKIEDMYKQILSGEPEIHAVFRTNVPDGSFHWIQCYGKIIYDENNIPVKVIGWMTPTTHLQELMLIMLEHLNDDYADKAFNKLFLEYVSNFFAVDATYFIGYGANNQREFEYHWNEKTYDFLHFMDINFAQITNEIEPNHSVELSLGERLKIGLISSKIKSASVIKKTIPRENKEYFLLLISCKEKRNWYKKEIDVLHWLISALTITEERNYAVNENAELKKKLSKDQITGLSKIETFKSNTDYLIDSNPDKTYAIIHSGFYNFQFINDNFGYAIGDAILNRFGKFMRNNLRSGRAFSRGSGDQFVFLIEYHDIFSAKEEFIANCKRFCNSIEQEIGINSLIITSGICHVKRKGSQKVSKAIDNAHLTRKSIRNRAETTCLIFKDAARANVAEQMKIAANMKRALQNQEFVVYLQPKTHLETGKLVGAEALVRWQLENGTMIYPDQFIPLFEENGFISQIDFYVLQRVLMYLMERKRKGLKLFTISVNFSRRHQDNPNFVPDIVALMDEYGIERKWIEIEITESAFMNDIHKLHENLIRLQENNITVSIDDFGSGYSSLNVLSTVPADVIKIDRGFLFASDEKSINMLKYLVLMIKGMGYQTIAEGVETKEQVLLLREIGCELAQGYFYAKPMSMENFNQYCLEVPM